MSSPAQVRRLMDAYPKIYFACHTRHVRDDASGHDLTSHQASILDHLDEADSLTLGALAEHMGVTSATMSIHVDRLVDKGFVTRRRDRRDGRVVSLRLTRAGVRVRDAKSVLDATRVRRLLRTMAPHDRERALEGLEALADAAAASMRSKSRRRGGVGRTPGVRS